MSENDKGKSEERQLSHRPDYGRTAYWKLLAKYADLIAEVRPSLFWSSLDLRNLLPSRRAERKKTIEEQKVALVKELIQADIDPATFDILLANETDRRLKVRFGVTFLVLTFLFTVGSYAIIISDAVYQWKISPVAITALIIETPIQFIGLLYIIARNLFPQNGGNASLQSQRRRRTEPSAPGDADKPRA